MKKYLLFLYFFVLLNGLKAQTDSLELEPYDFLENNSIKGTAALPVSNNQLMARRFGLLLESIIDTPCESDYHRMGETRINSLQLTDSSLVIDTKMVDNCCFSFICDIQVVEDSIINLISYGYGETHCACECCFGITYYLSIGAYRNDHEFNKIKAVMINNDRKTVMKLK